MPPTPQRRAHGPTVRAFREARGLSLAALADAVGLSKGHLSHVENGRYRAPLTVGPDLAATLDVPVEVLTGQVPPLRALRRLLDVSAEAIAFAAGTTVDRLARIERGTERAHADELAAIARRLGVDVAALDSDPVRAEPVA